MSRTTSEEDTRDRRRKKNSRRCCPNKLSLRKSTNHSQVSGRHAQPRLRYLQNVEKEKEKQPEKNKVGTAARVTRTPHRVCTVTGFVSICFGYYYHLLLIYQPELLDYTLKVLSRNVSKQQKEDSNNSTASGKVMSIWILILIHK